MSEILLCSHNPIMVKNLYGMLRDEGFFVETADHPALAVQMVMNWDYAAVIIDSEPFGLSAEDAVRIIRSVSPDMPVIAIGQRTPDDVLSIRIPVDLEEVRQVVHDIHQYQNIKGACL
jgi:DNA-binding NtrC family response regulator